MSHATYKVTITERDYHCTTYTAWVAASSRNEAMTKAGALAGQEKARLECERTGRSVSVEGLMAPQVRLEPVGTDEYYAHEEEVTVTTE